MYWILCNILPSPIQKLLTFRSWPSGVDSEMSLNSSYLEQILRCHSNTFRENCHEYVMRAYLHRPGHGKPVVLIYSSNDHSHCCSAWKGCGIHCPKMLLLANIWPIWFDAIFASRHYWSKWYKFVLANLKITFLGTCPCLLCFHLVIVLMSVMSLYVCSGTRTCCWQKVASRKQLRSTSTWQTLAANVIKITKEQDDFSS